MHLIPPKRKIRIAHKAGDRGSNLYETPAEAMWPLLGVEKLPSVIWEPAAGRGAIARVLRSAGSTVITSDIVARDFPLDFVADFLAVDQAPRGCSAIVTNPPYSRRVNKFVAHALDLCPYVAMLLRLSFLESEGRGAILEHRGLARVHVFRGRLPMMHRHGWDGPKASSAVPYAWFVWQRGHIGPPTINRISTFLDLPAPSAAGSIALSN